MRKLFLFMMVSLDGYFEGPDHDLSWHHVDGEFNAFAARQMQETGMILFGRRTYNLMHDYWPTYQPEDSDNKTIRDQMIMLPKIVFSKTVKHVEEEKDWKNITLKKELVLEEILALKKQSGKDISVLGSSNLCVSLLEQNLFDELRIMVNPVVVGRGTPLFKGLKKGKDFRLLRTRQFQNGNMLLYYEIEH